VTRWLVSTTELPKAKTPAPPRETPKAEEILWSKLRRCQIAGLTSFDGNTGIAAYVVDFYCPTARMAIEVDGDSHFPEGNLLPEMTLRQAVIESFGIRFVRFPNVEVFDHLDVVVGGPSRDTCWN